MNNLKRIKIGIHYNDIIYLIVAISPFLSYLNNKLISTYIPMILEGIYIVLIIRRKRGIIKSTFMMFIFWMIVITIINYGGNTTSLNRMVGELMTLLIVLMIDEDRDNDAFLKIYKKIAIICLIYFTLQVLLMYTISFPLQFTIPFLPVKEELELPFRFLSYYNKSVPYIRFPGPFSEPAHYAAYLTPLLAMELFDSEKPLKENWLLPLWISATMIISTSGIGIMLGMITWALYFVFYYRNAKDRIVMLPVVLLGAGIIIGLLMMYSEQFYITVTNLFFVTDTSRFSSGSKADYRIYRGFASYFLLPFINKIAGVGYANMNDFALAHGIRTIYDVATSGIEYYNGISQILLYSGIVGFILWFNGMLKYARKKSKSGKMFLIIYIFYIIGSGSLFSGYASIFLICASIIGKSHNISKNLIKEKNITKIMGLQLNES